jgi:predicted transcriptional regulator of viral defense system
MRPLNEIKSLFQNHGGMLRTSELYAERVFYNDIQKLIADGIIEKVRYGYYQWLDAENQSEAATVSRLFPDAIFCMDTALFYYRYSDRTPLAWHLAVSKDSGKSRFRLDYPFVKPYFIEPPLLEIGVTAGDMDGTAVRIYDKERTICDCLRYSGKMDKEIFNKAVRNYVGDPKKDIHRLMEYAKKLQATQKVKTLIGVWL